MNKSTRRLGLINYEGDVLAITPVGKGGIEVYDQWNNLIMIVTREELTDFLDGKSVWTDSSGKMWNYVEAHPDARTPINTINQFLNNEKV